MSLPLYHPALPALLVILCFLPGCCISVFSCTLSAIYRVFLLQSAVRPAAQQVIQHRHQRNEDQHADDAHESAADNHSRHDPDGRKPDGISHDVRMDELLFKLLQHEEEDPEDNRLNRIHRKDQHDADHASDKSSQDRDQRRKADHYAD